MTNCLTTLFLCSCRLLSLHSGTWLFCEICYVANCCRKQTQKQGQRRPRKRWLHKRKASREFANLVTENMHHLSPIRHTLHVRLPWSQCRSPNISHGILLTAHLEPITHRTSLPISLCSYKVPPIPGTPPNSVILPILTHLTPCSQCFSSILFSAHSTTLLLNPTPGSQLHQPKSPYPDLTGYTFSSSGIYIDSL